MCVWPPCSGWRGHDQIFQFLREVLICHWLFHSVLDLCRWERVECCSTSRGFPHWSQRGAQGWDCCEGWVPGPQVPDFPFHSPRQSSEGKVKRGGDHPMSQALSLCRQNSWMVRSLYQPLEAEPMQLGWARLTAAERQRRLVSGVFLYCGQADQFNASCPTQPMGLSSSVQAESLARCHSSCSKVSRSTLSGTCCYSSFIDCIHFNLSVFLLCQANSQAIFLAFAYHGYQIWILLS